MLQIHFIDLILIISACQSFFLSLLILRKYKKSNANRILAAMFLCYGLILTEMALWDAKIYTKYPAIMVIASGTPFLMGPLYYLYAMVLTRFKKRLRWKDLLHTIPFFLFLISMIPLLAEPDPQIDSPNPGELPLRAVILNWVIMIHIFIYSLFVILVVKKYSAKIKNAFSNIEKVKLDWIRNITLVFSGCVGLYIVENTFVTAGYLVNDYPFSSIGAAAFVYVMGYLLFIKSEVFSTPEFLEQIDRNIPQDNESFVVNAEQRYKKSGLTSEKAEEYRMKLINLMETEKPYLNSELTLNRLSDLTSIPPHHLSEIINVYMKQNFFDFINGYRVQKVKQDLSDPGKSNYTLLAIAMEAGFNSKSSFNMVFKKFAGTTPSEYRKKNAG